METKIDPVCKMEVKVEGAQYVSDFAEKSITSARLAASVSSKNIRKSIIEGTAKV